MSLEYRRVRGLHVRAMPDRREGRVIADVMIYNKVDDYRTAFAPGVFTESLNDHLPKMLWAHNMMEPIGRWIDVDDNSQRLRMVGELDLDMITDADGRPLPIPAVPMAHRAWTQLQKRTIDQFSVGFMRLQDSPHRSIRGATQIDKAWLDEASPVLVGSVPGTALVGVRSSSRTAPAPLERERRSVFHFESNRGKVRPMTTDRGESRANPIGYNQYKHMAGSTSPSAQKALKDGPRQLGGGSHTQAEKLDEAAKNKGWFVEKLGDTNYANVSAASAPTLPGKVKLDYSEWQRSNPGRSRPSGPGTYAFKPRPGSSIDIVMVNGAMSIAHATSKLPGGDYKLLP